MQFLDMEFLDVGEVKEGEEVLAVEFRCACGRFINESRIAQIDTRLIGEICQNQCDRCGKYSGFSLLKNQSADTPDKFTELCRVLTVNLKEPFTEETRWIIQELLKGRNLKLRFGIQARASVS